MANVKWNNVVKLESKQYVCGYCGNNLVSEEGFTGATKHHERVTIYICHYCGRPTFFGDPENQVPGALYADEVDGLPKEVEDLYAEARKCTSCNAYTASVLCSRKLLMNIAVSKGAQEGMKFAEYVGYLDKKHFIPPDGKEWVDHIRTKGNEATHEIKIMTREDAEQLITFAEMLLKLIYEFPKMIKGRPAGAS